MSNVHKVTNKSTYMSSYDFKRHFEQMLAHITQIFHEMQHTSFVENTF